MPFTPLHTGVGGLLLHLSTSTLLADSGRVLGISGVLDGAVLGQREGWRWSVLAGLVMGPVIAGLTGLSRFFLDTGVQSWSATPWQKLAVAGLLVGFGAKLGSGCTSGHMLCGVSRLSVRSIAATATFFSTALITANFLAPLPVTPVIQPSTGNDLLGIGLITASAYAVLGLVSYALRMTTIRSPVIQRLPYFLAGLAFSLGLCISGMVSPNKVISFLRITPLNSFDPSLAVIMITGVLPNAMHYLSLRKKTDTPKPGYPWETWQVPSRTDVDWRLFTGAAVFGVGWGLSGVCPGPAVVSLGQLVMEGLQGSNVESALRGWAAFAVSTLAGFKLARVI